MGPGPVYYSPVPIKRDEDVPMWSFTFKPVKDWEGFLNSHRLNGASDDELKTLEALHKRNWFKSVKESSPKPKYQTQSVILKTKIDPETGHVKVKVQENKLATMLRDMHMGKKIPQKVWLEAWMFAGRPYKEILEGLVKLKSSKNDPFPLLDVTKKEPVAKKILVPVKKY